MNVLSSPTDKKAIRICCHLREALGEVELHHLQKSAGSEIITIKFFKLCMFFAAVHSAFILNYSASIHSGFVRFREWLIIQPAFS